MFFKEYEVVCLVHKPCCNSRHHTSCTCVYVCLPFFKFMNEVVCFGLTPYGSSGAHLLIQD